MDKQRLTDEQVIKALECCKSENGNDCVDCPCQNITYEQGNGGCCNALMESALDLINRLKAENDDLFYKLTGVMCSVDKWLEGDELKQDEVNRAATMREKTLQIVEKLEAVLLKKEDTMQLLNEEHQYTVDELQRAKAEIERLKKDKADIISAVEYRINQAKEFAYKEFAERLKEFLLFDRERERTIAVVTEREIDGLLAELTPSLNKLPHNSLCETETYEG